MMGHSHAVSGTTVWLAGAAGLAAAGWPESPWHVVAGTVVCAGAALLPDLDHPSATIVLALGPVTRLLAKGIAAGSAAVHAATRTDRDRPNGNGHRRCPRADGGSWGEPGRAAALDRRTPLHL
jgi:hypothetical protein